MNRYLIHENKPHYLRLGEKVMVVGYLASDYDGCRGEVIKLHPHGAEVRWSPENMPRFFGAKSEEYFVISTLDRA